MWTLIITIAVFIVFSLLFLVVDDEGHPESRADIPVQMGQVRTQRIPVHIHDEKHR